MKQNIPFLFFLLFTLTTPIRVHGLGVGPPSLELQVPVDGSNSTVVYFTSDGLSGELIVGCENLPFKVEPETVSMSPDDVNKPLEITIYGNSTLGSGTYNGKLTFIGMTGGAVAMGVKLKINVEQYDPNPRRSLLGLNQGQLVLGVGIVSVASIILIYLKKNPRDSE